MQISPIAAERTGSGKLTVRLAQAPEEILDAQRLRYKVFVEEMGARLPVRHQGVDQDIYDPYCDHLLVLDGESNEVVGTYRILPSAQAKRLGGFYSDDEFDLTRIQHLRMQVAEVGRSCVHPDYRGGAVIALLWSGLAQYMMTHGYQYLMGCASMSMADGGHGAASLYARVAQHHLSPIEYRVFPRCRLPLEALDHDRQLAVPPLLKGYLRLGAYVCGEPAWDPDFNTADLLLLLPMARLNQRYARHFMK